MPNFKISQLEPVTNMDPDSFVLVVQNGKNYRMSIKEAIAAYVDLSPYYTKEETEEALNSVDTRIDTLEGLATFRIIPVSYLDLRRLRNNGDLVPGQQYRITDFATIVNSQFDSLELPFDIVVTALSSTRLSSSASALHRDIPDDTLKDFDLSSWKLKYSLDNDTDKFNWASEDGKGVIYGMVDEFNNSAPFDFYSIYPEGKPLFPYPFTGSSYNNTIKEDRNEDGQMLLPIVYFTEDVNNIEVSKNSDGEFVAYNVADLFASELPDNPSPDNPSPYSAFGTIYYIGEI